jgi:hypothetical protein
MPPAQRIKTAPTAATIAAAAAATAATATATAATATAAAAARDADASRAQVIIFYSTIFLTIFSTFRTRVMTTTGHTTSSTHLNAWKRRQQ